VVFRELENRIRPKDHVGELRAFLGSRYAPLRSNGDGLQSIYLAEISPTFASELYRLIGPESHRVEETAGGVGRANHLLRGTAAPDAIDLTIEAWEHNEELVIQRDQQLAETERDALVQARRGQGRYRANVQRVERACRVTRVDRAEHLVASHSKPWRDSTNDERLDGENGLLLTPTIDHLFDRGFISFENNGDLIVSPVAHHPSLARMGISVDERTNVGAFSQGQRHFLDYHRDNVLRLARVKRS
jgi:putative restriction endonuclease